MTRFRCRLLATLLVVLGSHAALFGTTVVAGSCMPTSHSYPTISAALGAVPPPTRVLVCPQTFNEQVVITNPVTLQGISSANSAMPVLAPPAGGLTQTTTNEAGQTVGYQLVVDNVSGPVNVSNIAIDAAGNNVPTCVPGPYYLVGIFYRNSSGAVNRVTTRNQKGNGCGIGVYTESGQSLQSVTITNSSLHDFDFIGIESCANGTIASNDLNMSGVPVDQPFGSPVGIFQPCGINKMFGNSILGGYKGIEPSAGSVSGNTIVDSAIGIHVIGGLTLSVTSNKIMFPTTYGVFIGSPTALVAGNSIMSVQGNGVMPGAIGIEFFCTANSSVHSNTINEAPVGVDQVPTGVSTNNFYANVGTISTGSCP